MRRAAAVCVLLGFAFGPLSGPGGGAATSPEIAGAPSAALVVRAAMAWLPPEDIGRVRSIEFVLPAALHNAGACGESVVEAGLVRLSTEPNCLLVLPGVVWHEYGHHTPACARLAYAGERAESEACAEAYRQRFRVVWP